MLICEKFHSHSLLYWTTYSCLMHQYLLDNSSDRVVCTTYTRASSGHSRRLSSETLITDKFTAIHLCHVCCRIPTLLGALEVAFLFWGNSIICTPLTNFLSYVLTGFDGEQAASVRIMEWWAFSVNNNNGIYIALIHRCSKAFSVLNESLLSSNIN